MATTVLVPGIPPPEVPSPALSESTSPSEMTDAPPPRRSRPRRSPSQTPLRTGFRNFSSVATVLVGEPDNKARPETRYLIHKELLTSTSPFFAAALNGTFAEGLDQTVRLPEEKPEIFEWFLQWLYTGTLKIQVPRCQFVAHNPLRIARNVPGAALTLHTLSPYPNHSGLTVDAGRLHDICEYDLRTDGDLRNAAGSPKYFLLLDLYALSDRLLTPQLSNHILNNIARLSEATNSVPTPSDTWILYGETIRDTAPIRTLILDLFAYKKTDRLLETHKDDWHPRFLRELCVKLKRPGPEAIERHSLAAWRPADWSSSRACEICKELLQPGVSGDKCCACEKVFCGNCLRGGLAVDGGQGVLQGKVGGLTDTGGCKPWSGKGMCLRYHQHVEGEECG